MAEKFCNIQWLWGIFGRTFEIICRKSDRQFLLEIVSQRISNCMPKVDKELKIKLEEGNIWLEMVLKCVKYAHTQHRYIWCRLREGVEHIWKKHKWEKSIIFTQRYKLHLRWRQRTRSTYTLLVIMEGGKTNKRKDRIMIIIIIILQFAI